MTDAQGWTLLGLVGVLLSVIGGLMVAQFGLLRTYLDARFTGLEGSIDVRFDAVDARFDGLQALMDARFDAVYARFVAANQRFDHLDRDVQAVSRVVFPGE